MSTRLHRYRFGKKPPHIDACIRALVNHAFDKVPYIREQYQNAGVSPQSIAGLEDLPRLPRIHRNAYDMRFIERHLRSGAKPSRLHSSPTSGTTGLHLDVYASTSETAYRRMLLYRSMRKIVRIPLGFRIVHIWPGVFGAKEVRHYGLGRVFPVSRKLPLATQAALVRKASPHIITGPTTCIELIAEQILSDGAPFPKCNVLCRGETVFPEARDTMRRAFRGHIGDLYSVEEIGNVAWECRENPGVFHIQTDGCHVEIVDSEGQSVPAGTPGSVLLTNLFNWTMPFIRYEVGDIAALARPEDDVCRCGHSGPTLVQFDGRADDYIVREDGSRLSPRVVISAMRRAFRNFEAENNILIPRYKVEQQSERKMHIQVLSPVPLTEQLRDALREGLMKYRLGPIITIERMSELPLEPSGKFRRIISQVSPSENAGKPIHNFNDDEIHATDGAVDLP